MFSAQLAQLHSNALCPYYIIGKQLSVANSSQTVKVFVRANQEESIWIIVSGFMRGVHVSVCLDHTILHTYKYKPVLL